MIIMMGAMLRQSFSACYKLQQKHDIQTLSSRVRLIAAL